jgi:hypothetical protein
VLDLLLTLTATTLMSTVTPLCRSQDRAVPADPDGAVPLAPVPVPVPAAADFTLRPSPRPAGLRWQLPPLDWAGSLAYDHRVDRSAGRTEQVQQLVTARIGASTYLYQPWLATLGGQLGLTTVRSDSADPGRGSGERFVTGQGELNIFPRSRFPFELRYESSDSRINPSLAQTLSFRSHELSATQRYRPEGGQWQLGAGFTRRDQLGQEFGHDTQRIWSLDASGASGDHHLAFNWADQRAERERRAEQALYHTVVARHSYTPSQAWSVETTGNWTRTETDFAGSQNQIRLAQGSTLAFWRPEGQPWTVSASARALTLDDELDGGHLETRGASLGATWAVTDALRLAASTSLNEVESGPISERSLARSLGANWQSTPVALGPLRYEWYAGVALSDLRGRTLHERSGSGQLGHGISRSWISDTELWQWSLNQSLTSQRSHLSGRIATDAASGSSAVLAEDTLSTTRSRLDTHSTALTWQSNGARHAYARASFSDARELGDGSGRMQLINLQAAGQFELDRWRTLNGDLTWQQVRQRSGSEVGQSSLVAPTRYGSHSVGGELSYQQRYLWRQPGLTLGARLRIARDVLTSQSLALLPERETRLAEVRLDYRIGKLETGLLLRRSQFDGVWRDLLMWRIQRNLGGASR